MATAAPAWTVQLCCSTPGAEDIAEIAASRGAAVIWCGPECCEDEEDDVSVYDDGTDLAPGLTEVRNDTGAPEKVLPATETRGGEDIDWDNARPGEPLPEKPPEPDDWTPEPGWGLT